MTAKNFVNIGDFFAEIYHRPPEREWKFKGGSWKFEDGREGEALRLYLDARGDQLIACFPLADHDPDTSESLSMLTWIFMMNRQPWATAGLMRALLRAMDYIFAPEALCSAELKMARERRVARAAETARESLDSAVPH